MSSNQRAKEKKKQATDIFTDKAMESNARLCSLTQQKGI